MVNYFSKQVGKNLAPVFEQYLQGKLNCRWIADVKGFNMPVRIKIKEGKYQFISPSRQFTPVDIKDASTENILVDTFNYYIGVLVD